MEVLQFVCFTCIVVAFFSICSYYNAEIEELEKDIQSLYEERLYSPMYLENKVEVLEEALEKISKDVDILHDNVNDINLELYGNPYKKVSNSYLKILEIEAINSKIDDKDLVVLQELKREALQELNDYDE